MPKINLPKEMLKKEAFKTLSAKEKEEYIRNLLIKILELNPEGITISEIKEATGLTYSTLWHHLGVLSSTAQSYKVSRGNVDIYYPAESGDNLNEYNKGKSSYRLSLVQNKEGKFICIQEKNENRLGNNRVCRGIAIPLELIDNFVADINKIKKSQLRKK